MERRFALRRGTPFRQDSTRAVEHLELQGGIRATRAGCQAEIERAGGRAERQSIEVGRVPRNERADHPEEGQVRELLRRSQGAMRDRALGNDDVGAFGQEREAGESPGRGFRSLGRVFRRGGRVANRIGGGIGVSRSRSGVSASEPSSHHRRSWCRQELKALPAELRPTSRPGRHPERRHRPSRCSRRGLSLWPVLARRAGTGLERSVGFVSTPRGIISPSRKSGKYGLPRRYIKLTVDLDENTAKPRQESHGICTNFEETERPGDSATDRDLRNPRLRRNIQPGGRT